MMTIIKNIQVHWPFCVDWPFAPQISNVYKAYEFMEILGEGPENSNIFVYPGILRNLLFDRFQATPWEF